MAQLAGVPLPPGEQFDGASLVPLLSGGGAAWGAKPAYSQYPRRVTHPDAPWKGNSILHKERDTFTHMGYTLRTADFRYTRWLAWNGSTLAPQSWDAPPAAQELYDHRGERIYPVDFDAAAETANVAADPSLADVVASLAARLRAQFEGGGSI